MNRYLNRMLVSGNPRQRDLAEKIIAKRDRRYASAVSQIEHLQAKYKRLTGKAADKRWSEETLLAKILAAQDASPACAETRAEIVKALDKMERKS